MNWRRALLPVLFLAVAAAGFAGLRATRPAAQPVAAQEQVWQVRAVTVAPGRATPTALLYAVAEAPQRARLSASLAAEVLAAPVAEGRRVAQGELLVRIDTRDIDLALRQRAADLAEIAALIDSERQRHASDRGALVRERELLQLAERGVERAEDLVRRRLGSESVLDDARQALARQRLALVARELALQDHPARLAQLEARQERVQAQHDQAELDRQRAEVRAPFAGRVARVMVAAGDRVRVGDVLLELYPQDGMELRAQLPYRHLGSVRRALDAGQPLAARASLDGRQIEARLDRLAGEAAASSGGVDALFRLAGADLPLVPGQLLPLVLELPPEDAVVALPTDALYGLDRVYRLVDERLEALSVERVGERRSIDGSAEVLVRASALRSGDRVVATQLPNAVAGLRVRTMEPDGR